MRLRDIDSKGGNQDRSLSAEAVIYPGSVTIVKQATPEGATSFPFTASPTPLADFALVDDGTTANTKVFSGITDFKTYTVTEATPAGWSLVNAVCSVTSANGGSQTVNGATATIDLKEGENVTCTYGNSADMGSITIIKDVVNALDANDPTTFNFALSGTAADTFSLGDNGQKAYASTATGYYKVSETRNTNYKTVMVCTSSMGSFAPGYDYLALESYADFTLRNGENVTCTFTNTFKVGTLKVHKALDVVGDGSYAIDDTLANTLGFRWGFTGDPIDRLMHEIVSPVASGTHSVTENDGTVPGYHFTGWYTMNSNGESQFSCAKPEGTTLPATVTVPEGDTIQLVFCNAKDTGSLTVIKHVVGSNEPASSWTMDVTGPTPLSFAGQDTPGVTNTVFAGTYTVTESGPTGYTLTYSGACDAQGTLTIANGEHKTCTLTNTRDTGTLIVHKNVLNPDGQEVADTHAFSVLLNGGSQKTIAEGTDATYSNLPTGTYTIVENADGNYDFVSYSADSDANTAGAQVTVSKGQTTELTVTNMQKKATITIYKDVRDYQGNNVDDTTNFDVNTFTIAEGDPEVLSVNPGTYTFTEAAHANYTIHSTNPKDLTVASNGSTSYTFVNWQKTGSISGMKFEDVNGNGQKDPGEPGLKDWNICYGDYGATVAAPTCVLTDVNGNYTFGNVPAGTYDIWEVWQTNWKQTMPNGMYADTVVAVNQTLTGYDFGNFELGRIWGYKLDTLGNKLAGWEICLNGTFACDTTDANGKYEFTGLTAGTYTVAETLQQGWWAVTPLIAGYIVPVTSGTDEQRDFTNFQGIDLKVKKLMDADGNTQTSGDQTPKSGWTIELWKDGTLFDTQVTDVNGSYTWTNLGPADYIVKEVFDASVYQALTPTQFAFTAVSGQDKEYTFINFKTPKLTVIKHVINDNGGTASADDFTMTVGGNNVSDNSFPGDENGTTVTLNAGAYSVDELLFPGYAKTLGANCTGTVQSGDEVTCTITNDDIAPSLTLNKIVVKNNGGTAVESDWTLTADGNAAGTLSGPGAAGNTDVVSGAKFKAGTYALSESTGPSGYAASAWSCVKNNGQPVTGSSITLDLADTATCTITNDDVTAHLKLVKVVTKDNGGTAVPANWMLRANGPTPFQGAGTVETNVDAGTYTLSEFGGPTGYIASNWVCDNGTLNGSDLTLALNQSATCTITNDDIQPKLTVTKIVINDNGGTAVVADFPLFVNATGVTSGVQNGFNAGAYTVSETNKTGYTATITGDCAANGAITLQVGDVKSCTITNNDIQPKLTVTKVVINDNGGTAVVADFPLFVDQTGVVSGVQNGFNAASYVVSETNLTGYTASITGDCDKDGNITLLAGDVKSCTITNNDVAPKLKLIKSVVNDNGGTKVIADFPLFVNGNGVTSGQWNTLTAGVQYTATETTDPGYQASVWGGDCAANGTITLGVGDAKVCTITNNDIQPKLTVTKVVVNDNGGTAVVADFPLFVDQTGVTSGVQNGFNANDYVVSETNLTGYSAVISGDCDANGNVSLSVGDVKSCTITNNDIQPKLTVTKVVINDNGGTAVVADFPLFVDQTSVSSGVQNGFNADDYVVSETNLTGYEASITGDCDKDGKITLHAGDVKSCTITNNDIPGRVVGFKYEDVNRNGIQDSGENPLGGWTFYLRADSATGEIKYTSTLSDATTGYFEFTGVNMGTYYLTEALPAKWDQITPSAGFYQVVVTPGYDNGRMEAPFIFGNAPEITLGIAKYNDHEVGHGGTGVAQTTETINYHIDWSVAGNSIAQNVILTDIIPAQLNLNVASISNSGVWDAATRTITWNYGTQQPNASGFVTYSATIIVPIANGTAVTNTAKVSADNADPKFAQDTSTFTVASAPQLQITKTVSATIVNPGDPVTYTVKVKNIGTDTAINAVMTDTLPAGFTFVTTSPTAASIVGQTGTWNLGNMAVGDEKTITYTVNVAPGTAAGSYDNLAKAKADNASEVSTKVTVEVRVPKVLGDETAPVLQLRKTVSKSTVAPGDVITYTVEIKNTGSGSAINVILTDLLPAGFTFKGTSLTMEEWKLGDIAVGETKKVSYQVTVGKSVPNGSYENLAIAQADNHGKVNASVPVNVKRGRVLAETVDTGASVTDLGIAGIGLGLIILGYVLTRKRGEELA